MYLTSSYPNHVVKERKRMRMRRNNLLWPVLTFFEWQSRDCKEEKDTIIIII